MSSKLVHPLLFEIDIGKVSHEGVNPHKFLEARKSVALPHASKQTQAYISISLKAITHADSKQLTTALSLFS